MTIASFTKDPAAKLDYSIDWSEWLPEGDTIVSATWVATGVTIAAAPLPSLVESVATVWIEGGTVGTTGRVTCQVTTTAGRIDERSISLSIKER